MSREEDRYKIGACCGMFIIAVVIAIIKVLIGG